MNKKPVTGPYSVYWLDRRGTVLFYRYGAPLEYKCLTPGPTADDIARARASTIEWGWYVAALALGGIIGVLLIRWMAAKI